MASDSGRFGERWQDIYGDKAYVPVRNVWSMCCEYWTDCNAVEGGKHSGDIDVASS